MDSHLEQKIFAECRRISIDANQCANYIADDDKAGAVHNLEEIVQNAIKLKDSIKSLIE